jgi:hypothetical protein
LSTLSCELEALGEEGEHDWSFAKDPSVEAFTDLMNRALDKAREQEIEMKLSNEAHLLERLDEGRRRNAAG